MHIIVRDEVIEDRFEKDGQTKVFYKQQAAIVLPGGQFPVPFMVGIDTPAVAYKEGVKYSLSTSSFKIERGRLGLDAYNLSLVPISDADANSRPSKAA